MEASVKYLGHIIDKKEYTHCRLEGRSNLGGPYPTQLLKSFLGLIYYYRYKMVVESCL